MKSIYATEEMKNINNSIEELESSRIDEGLCILKEKLTDFVFPHTKTKIKNC